MNGYEATMMARIADTAAVDAVPNSLWTGKFPHHCLRRHFRDLALRSRARSRLQHFCYLALCYEGLDTAIRDGDKAIYLADFAHTHEVPG